MNATVERVRELFGCLEDVGRAEPLMDALYAPSVVFEDPIQKTEGIEALKKMNRGFSERLKEFRFEVHGVTGSDEAVAVHWTMRFKIPVLPKAYALPGVSWLSFGSGGRCVAHTDYWDFMQMADQVMPVLKPVHDLLRRLVG